MSRFPCLVPAQMCKTEIELKLDREGTTKYGEPFPPIEISAKCNYQDKAKRVFTEEKKVIQITGRAIFPGDLCEELPVITSGKAVIFGTVRNVVQGRKARNPDGSVNYTEVMLE